MSNLLPYDGFVTKYEPISKRMAPERLFGLLMDEIPWQRDIVMMFGKRIETKRKVAWFADHGLHYTYSGIKKDGLPWTPTLILIKAWIETQTGETYNSCLANLYENGSQGMGWHSDNEKALKPRGAIASVSIGAARRFLFKHRKTAEKVELFLENGSVLLMKGTTQEHWVHALPVSKKCTEPRINLTYRTITG